MFSVRVATRSVGDRDRLRAWFASGLAVLALAVGLIAVPAAPASAHEQLLSTTPTSGERLAAAPAEVTLEFSGEVLTLGAVVIVADAAGTDWAMDPEIDGRIVTVPLVDGMPDAGYEIRWRVVSADGHPISGLVPFTVGDGAPYSSIADGGAREDLSPSGVPAETTPGRVPEPAAAAPAAALPIWRLVLVGIGGAAVATLGYLVFLSVRRRRHTTIAVSGATSGAEPRTDA